MTETLNTIFQRHADYYLPMLFEENPDPAKLLHDLPQIAVAKRRLVDEEVGFSQHPGMVEVQYKKALQLHYDVYLAKLVEGKATKEDIQYLQLYVEAVEKGDIDYPVSAVVLRNKLDNLEKS